MGDLAGYEAVWVLYVCFVRFLWGSLGFLGVFRFDCIASRDLPEFISVCSWKVVGN